jgi:hypothetical protein
MIFMHLFFVRWIRYTGLSNYGGRHSGGGGGSAEAPRNVIIIDWRIIYPRF